MKCIGGIGLAILGLCSVQAATITWNTPVTITGSATDVSLNGTLVAAYSGNGTAVTLNGVTFNGYIPGLPGSSSGARYVQGLATGNYYDLMYTAGHSSATTGTISLSGLTIGRKYEVQIWASDNNYANANTLKRTLTAGASSVDVYTEVVADTGSGQYVIGTFTADSTTQEIAVESQVWALINAMQVRVLPYITWDTPVTITGSATDVSLNGTLVAAYSGNGTVVTLNGVTFQGYIPGLPGSSSGARYAQGLAAGDYYNLMHTAGHSSATAGTISLSGLTTGQQYEVQIWASDNNYANANTLKRTLTTGNHSVNVYTEISTTGPGQYVIGTFTADSATQDIAVDSQAWAAINAMQLRIFPSTFEGYQALHQIGGPTDDDDGDLISNLYEYFADLDPNVADVPGDVMWMSADSNTVSFHLIGAKGGREDLLVEIQKKEGMAGLNNWLTLAARHGNGPWLSHQPIVTTPGSGQEEMVLFETATNLNQGFYRVRLRQISDCASRPDIEDPAYDVNDPMYPVVYTEAQKTQQRTEGTAMLADLNAAVSDYKNGLTSTNTYVIPSGVYRLESGQGINLYEVHDFTIVAQDVEIISEASDGLFNINSSSDITIKGPLTYDSDSPIQSQGTILSVDTVAKTIDVAVMDGYPMEVQLGTIFAFTPDGTWIGNDYNTVNAVAAQNAINRVLRLTLQNIDESYYAPGNLVAFGDIGSDNNVMVFPGSGCTNLTLEDISIHTGKMVWWGSQKGDWTFTRVKSTRRPGTNRLVGPRAGGQQSTHKGPGGSLTMDECEVGYSRDDLLNIRGGVLFLTLEQESSRVAILYGGDYSVGDTLTFYDFPSYVRCGTAKVVSMETLTDPAYETTGRDLIKNVLDYRDKDLGDVRRVTFDRDLSLDEADIVENNSLQPESIHIKNSYFHDGTVRVMIQGFKNATFENNVFRRVNWGLWVCTDVWWWEGSMAGNILIHNNVFENTSYNQRNLPSGLEGAILVGPLSGLDESVATDVYSNIHIMCNKIKNPSEDAIRVQNSRGVWISNNEIDSATNGTAVYLKAVEDAFVDGNRFVDTLDEVYYDSACTNIVIQYNYAE